ncbi:L,D-transpeptidase [Plectonema cf. radiosum LEGE 06105]|uniref:L,D-transpeptidase n=1 Tax=Plectonema cf. radiosum LEGE 06105 TaxID=945769 RepID=A0A8J7F531_9CYAN|nr:L,D-transpeptidase [Plectonema radiosum]MBE9216043.1 L,D-transpeptidase [Plectonema cf. radiosum LEGE 06105]
MVRNDSLARIVMLLCFGTAILSLTLHWRISTSMPNTVKDSSRVSTNEPFDFFARQIRDFVSLEKDVTEESLPKSKLPSKTQAASPQQSEAKRLNNASLEKKVVVDLGDRRAYVYRQNTVIASYPIGVGKKGWETPTGTFEVLHMQHYPAWKHPITGKVFAAGPNSPLGERWIGFWSDGHNEIGFHGTPESDLVGSPVSHGCLRMRNSDVRLLYEQIDLGVAVEVRK